MSKKNTMHKQIILLFICLVTLPIVVIFSIASSIFMRSTRNDLKALYSANVNEVGKNIEVLLHNALDLTLYPISEQNIKNYLCASPEETDYLLLKQNAANILISMPFGYTEGIQSIGLYTRSGDFITAGNAPALTRKEVSRLSGMGPAAFWNYDLLTPDSSSIYLLRHLRNPSNLSQYIGYIKLSIRSSSLENAIYENKKDPQTSYFVLTPAGDSIISADSSQYGEIQKLQLTYSQLADLSKSSLNSVILDEYILSAYPLSNTGLLLYSISKPEALTLVTNDFLKTMALLSVLIFCFCLLLSIRFSTIITKPLKQLGKYMTSISKEDYTVRIHMEACMEISLVADQFNHMAERLEYLYNQVYLGDLKLKQSQLDVLQTQINPHFLYNTLDTIYWMARLGKTEEVSAMVSNMSRMMRLTLAPRDNDKITLSQELEHLSCYTAIQKIRYGEKVSFLEEIDPALSNSPVLSFLLQPLVENALHHGLANEMHGIVKIKVYEENHTLIYQVANNGTPIQEEAILRILNTEDNRMQGFALRNIKERLRLKYGTHGCLTCYRRDTFSIFQITQPKEERIHDPSTAS